MRLSLRPVTLDDEEFLLRVYASTRLEEVSAWGWTAAQQNAFLRMQFMAQRGSYAAAYPHAEHRLILVDDEPAGRILVDRGGQEIRLVDIALLPEYRNRGAGTFVIRNLIEESRTLGKPLRLQVTKVNRAARLYERLGFSKTAEDEIYWEMECAP
jgi:ribosomal protein S18 acetylase RimI-like enzyme